MISRLILSIREEASGSGGSHARSTTIETTGVGSLAFFHSVTVIEEHDLTEDQLQQAERKPGDGIGLYPLAI
jgi:hypothetical protein